MKKSLISVALTGLLIAGCGGDEATEEQTFSLENEDQKVGYAMGRTFASRVESDLPDLEKDAFVQGVTDGLEGRDSLMTDEEIQETLMAFQQRMMEEQTRSANSEADANQAEADEFLAENAQRDEVTVTDSGLQFEVLEEGDGDSPGANSTVTVHYTGTLLDGTVFDSSRDRGEPVSFPLQNVIPGWTEGLQLMQEGDRFKLFLPPELAYGPGGNQSIPPNAALIFDVELISID